MQTQILQPVESLPELTFAQNRACVLAACGYSNKDIASRLKLSEHTVKIHIKSAFAVLDITNRTELLKFFGVHIAVLSHYEPSPEETAVLVQISEGKAYEDVADAVGARLTDVKSIMRRLLDRVKVRNRTQLACWWLVKTGRAATADVRETIAVTGWDDENRERLRSLCAGGANAAALCAEFYCNKDELMDGVLSLLRSARQVAA